jgi:thioredoxin 1
MKRHLFLLFTLTLLASSSFAAELKESRYKYVQASIGKGKPYFLEVGAKSCASCQDMSHTLGTILDEQPNLNIHFINAQKERSAAQSLEVRMIPTQIIYDERGKEVYRNVGVLNKIQVEALLKRYKF